MDLVTEKPSKKSIPEGYKKSEIGVIPKDWSCEKLGTVGDVVMGQSPPGSSYNKGGKGVPLINGPTEFTKYTPKKIQWSTQPTKFCKPKDILLCVRGSSTGRINISDDEYCIGRGIGAIRAKSNFVNKYLEYQLRNAVNEIVSRTSGSTFPNIPGSTLRKIQIPFPPTLEEQRAIAEALSDVDAFIAELDALIEKKQQVKKGAMQQLLTGKKRLPGFDGVWEEKKLGDIIENIVGGGTPRRNNSNFWDGEIPWATVKDLNSFRKEGTKESITVEGLKNSSANLVPSHTLITSTRMALGKAVIYDVDVAINQDLKALFTKSELDTEYLFNWFKTNKDIIKRLGSGSTVKGISLTDLKGLMIRFPSSLKEQKAIAKILSDMDSEIHALQAKRSKYEKIKQGMMQELLTGKTRLV